MKNKSDQEKAIAQLEAALGQSIEKAAVGPHLSIRMRGPGTLAGKLLIFVGALWDERDGLQVLLRQEGDKLCATVHFSWLCSPKSPPCEDCQVEGSALDPDEDPYPSCPLCNGPGTDLGSLGLVHHYRCVNCGADFSPVIPLNPA